MEERIIFLFVAANGCNRLLVKCCLMLAEHLQNRMEHETVRHIESSSNSMEENIFAPAVQVKRTVERNPLPLCEKLEELCSFSKTTPPCVKGQEGKYLNDLLLNYQHWFRKSLGAKGTFDETAFRIEKLGRKRDVQV